MASESTSFINHFITPKCYDKFFVGKQFETECMKSVISKLLGYSIVLGSVLVKVPQIVKILRANSAEGISVFGVVLELIAVTGTLAYSYANGFPFSAYGDALFMTLQQLIIMFLVLLFDQDFMSAVVYTSVYSIIIGYLMSPQVSMPLLTWLQASVVVLVVISRFSQAITNYQNKGTGQLSFLTVFLQFAGASIRILTSIHETGDSMTVFLYIVSTFTNAILLVQILRYWNVPTSNVGSETGSGGSGRVDNDSSARQADVSENKKEN